MCRAHRELVWPAGALHQCAPVQCSVQCAPVHAPACYTATKLNVTLSVQCTVGCCCTNLNSSSLDVAYFTVLAVHLVKRDQKLLYHRILPDCTFLQSHGTSWPALPGSQRGNPPQLRYQCIVQGCHALSVCCAKLFCLQCFGSAVCNVSANKLSGYLQYFTIGLLLMGFEAKPLHWVFIVRPLPFTGPI